MARESLKARELKRERLVAKYAEKRAAQRAGRGLERDDRERFQRGACVGERGMTGRDKRHQRGRSCSTMRCEDVVYPSHGCLAVRYFVPAGPPSAMYFS